MVPFSTNDTVFHLKKFAKLLINLKFIKIIIIKNKKYLKKKKKGWPDHPQRPSHPQIGRMG
jgi:hypothetical protein